MQQLHAIVAGRVQGVSFRYYTVRQALSLGLKGWVRNLPDGTVEVMATGEREPLEKLLTWLHKGPSGAYVIQVDFEWSNATQTFNTFDIRYGTADD